MLDIVTQLVVYLLTISVASERLTEILKRTFVKDTAAIPKWEGAIYQIIAALFGAFACWLSPPNLGSVHLNQYLLIVVVGLAVSGGSGAWNSVLEFLKQVAEAKKIDNAKQSG